MPPPRNLLICFDAFGTLFHPKAPIAQQYGDVARKFGLTGFTDEDVGRAFKAAFKQESRDHPNYGKAKGLGPETWWTNIINNTFKSIIRSNQTIPEGMVPNLLHRFWCEEGYTLSEDVGPLIRRIREVHGAEKSRVVVGVITNSDDRVPDVLTSLGVRVRPLRYGSHLKKACEEAAREGEYDVDFSVISYDVGHEKPDCRIFEAAEEVLSVAFQRGGSELSSQWRKVYVGDEYDKDVVGAVNAGWKAVLIDREGAAAKRRDMIWLDEKPVRSLFEVFESAQAVGFSSLHKLAEWIPSRRPT